MSGQTHNLLHLGVLPNNNLVLAIAVRTDNLVRILTPCKIAHLTACVDLLDHCSGASVPKFDAPISCTASRSEQMMLMGRPRHGFDSCSMGGESVERCFGKFVPDTEFIVISTRCELAVFGVPT